MKRRLATLFYWHDPGKGLVFALTLFTLGAGLWCSLFVRLMSAGLIPAIWLPSWGGTGHISFEIWRIGIGFLWLYSLAVFGTAVWRLRNVVRQNRNFRALWWGIPAAIALIVGGAGVSVFVAGGKNMAVFFATGPEYDAHHIANAICRFVAPLEPYVLFYASLLLLLIGYLLAAKLAAACEKKKLRQSFGRAALVLWGLALVAYAVALPPALNASRRTAQTRLAVERRFGRPLTAVALEEMYRENGKIDGNFWRTFLARHDALMPESVLDPRLPVRWGFELPDRPEAEQLAAFEQFCHQNADVLKQWESDFATVPPLAERQFVTGSLVAMLLPQLSPLRSFVRLETSRIKAALRRKDLPAALAAYGRIKNSNEVLRREPCLIGSLVWIAVENIRLDNMERLLESRLPSDQQVMEFDGELVKLEQAVPRNHQQAMYSEAVFGQDILNGLKTGKLIDAPLAWAPLRWVFPQLWMHVAKDEEYMLRAFLADDFTKESEIVPPANFLSAMLLPALPVAGRRFYALTARVRAMRVLLRAERYRREHGTFPEKLSELPLDPFTGTALRYGVGETKISELFWAEREVKSRTRSVRAVQVWSVGPNLSDENGWNFQDGNSPRHDDVRAMLLLLQP